MHRITASHPHPLFDQATTRAVERAAAAHLPAHTLMQRAGLAIAQLAQALAPHAQHIWIACGPGNNGGDGLEAAMHLHRAGRQVTVTLLVPPEQLPADAHAAWQRAAQAGVTLADQPPPALGPYDLCIDALLGLGVGPASRRNQTAAHRPARPYQATLLHWLDLIAHCPATVLAVDLPSGLQGDTGQYAPALQPAATPMNDAGQHSPGARHTLALLRLHPGLFTGAGRDAAGEVWLHDLGESPSQHPQHAPCAWLAGPPMQWQWGAARPHNSHKGSYGDVAVVGGEGLARRGMAMGGAALLAARAALHSGAGRVMVALLNGNAPHGPEWDPGQPELMLRHPSALQPSALTVVAGCGGGAAIAAELPRLIEQSARLVLDADALNAVAADPALRRAVAARARRDQPTVLTPHPLEAARLLACSTEQVQAHRLAAAQQLAAELHCAVVLKGSGSVIAAPGELARINPTGNARLATAGTGDVLAGMVGAALAAGTSAWQAATQATYLHGQLADQWPAHRALTASALARALGGTAPICAD